MSKKWMPDEMWLVDDESGGHELNFHVNGIPVAQGSKRHVGKGVMLESSKALQPWREAVIHAALAAADGHVFFGAVSVSLAFHFPRPKAHYGTGRNSSLVKISAPIYKASAPDLDKLCRAVLDALTHSGVLRDDALVVFLNAHKFYSTPHGVKVRIHHV